MFRIYPNLVIGLTCPMYDMGPTTPPFEAAYYTLFVLMSSAQRELHYCWVNVPLRSANRVPHKSLSWFAAAYCSNLLSCMHKPLLLPTSRGSDCLSFSPLWLCTPYECNDAVQGRVHEAAYRRWAMLLGLGRSWV